jgi:hypothetical protein
MLEDTALWIVGIGSLAGVGMAFAFPASRPYAKKFWWVAVAVAAVAIGYVLLRRRPGNVIDDQIAAGKDIAEQNSAAVDAIIDMAHEKIAWSDAELARKQLQSQAVVDRMDAELETVKKIDDSLERRKALIKVVESYG